MRYFFISVLMLFSGFSFSAENEIRWSMLDSYTGWVHKVSCADFVADRLASWKKRGYDNATTQFLDGHCEKEHSTHPDLYKWVSVRIVYPVGSCPDGTNMPTPPSTECVQSHCAAFEGQTFEVWWDVKSHGTGGFGKWCSNAHCLGIQIPSTKFCTEQSCIADFEYQNEECDSPTDPDNPGPGENPDPDPDPNPDPGGDGENPNPDPGGDGNGENPNPDPGGDGENPNPDPGGDGDGENPNPNPDPDPNPDGDGSNQDIANSVKNIEKEIKTTNELLTSIDGKAGIGGGGGGGGGDDDGDGGPTAPGKLKDPFEETLDKSDIDDLQKKIKTTQDDITKKIDEFKKLFNVPQYGSGGSVEPVRFTLNHNGKSVNVENDLLNRVAPDVSSILILIASVAGFLIVTRR